VTVREVLRFPHPSLKTVARPLEPEESAQARRVAADLVDTMRSFPGCVGIAAPQVDELVRVVAIDLTGHRKVPESHGLQVLVNPRVLSATGAEVGREGCLSLPDFTANVRRAVTVSVEFITPKGEHAEIEAHGFEARCLLHELDHLDGLLFLDRVDSLHGDVFPRKRYGEGGR